MLDEVDRRATFTCGFGLVPPFYAVKVNPGDATTTLGLVVDGRARVLDDAGLPIAGLYACGLDMNSLWRGVPPANGANNTLTSPSAISPRATSRARIPRPNTAETAPRKG